MDCCAEFGAKLQEIQKRAEPVEKIIKDHPLPSVLIGVGVGALIGALVVKYFLRRE
jgi:ElaB/YqjD/DUF883 family membrane-anchored ribosome-binding protein